MEHVEPRRGDTTANIRKAKGAHTCDERCVCRSSYHAGGSPALIYARGSGEHACPDTDCPNGHGMTDWGPTMEHFAVTRDRLGFHPIPEAITCPRHVDICIGTNLWSGFCSYCGTTAEQARLEREKLGGMTAERMQEAIEAMRTAGWAAWHRPEPVRSPPLALRLLAGSLYGVGAFTGWAIGKAALAFGRASKKGSF